MNTIILMSGSQLSGFTPLGRIGEGSYSSVYKVRRQSDQCIYALKKIKMACLKQKERANALNEVRLLASLASPYVITYKQAFFDEPLQLLCIVMEFADGGDLLHRITDSRAERGGISEQEVWRMALHVLSGLQQLHEGGILHRDLKSANIFISGGVYKLGDLNVSKVSRHQERLASTQTGTPYYASPQIWRDQPYGSAADIWSFGCILYEMCTGRPPFHGKDLGELFRHVQRGIYNPPPKQYSPSLHQLIQNCLKLQAGERPSARSLLQRGGVVREQCDFWGIDCTVRAKTKQQQLLATIQMPSDLNKLNSQLPHPQYQVRESERKLYSSAPKQPPPDLDSKPQRDPFTKHLRSEKAEKSDVKVSDVLQKRGDRVESRVNRSQPLKEERPVNRSQPIRYDLLQVNRSEVLTNPTKGKDLSIPLPERIKNHLSQINRDLPEKILSRKAVPRQKMPTSIDQTHKDILQRKIEDYLSPLKQPNKRRPVSCSYKIRQIDCRQISNSLRPSSSKQSRRDEVERKQLPSGRMANLIGQSGSEKFRCRSAVIRDTSNSYNEVQRRLNARQQNIKPIPLYALPDRGMPTRKYQAQSEVSLLPNSKYYPPILQPQARYMPLPPKMYGRQESLNYLQQIQNKILNSDNPKARKCEVVGKSRWDAVAEKPSRWGRV